MTADQTPPDPVSPDPVSPEPAQQTPAIMPGGPGGMSGEMMVMISGIIILGVYVVFGLIADEWYPSFVSVVAGTFAIFLPRMKTHSVGPGLTAASLLKITGYVIAVAGLWDFVFSLRFGWGGAFDILGWLILGAAAVLGFLGARAIQT
jgi:hypothetical protein